MARDEQGRRSALDRLLPMQQSDFEGIFEAMAGLPVTIRLLDPPLHEFLPAPEEAPERDARADQAAPGVEPDARHARLPARAPVPGDLRDAGARDRPRSESRPGQDGRGAARRDHAPARRLRRRAAPAARADRRRRRRGERRRVSVRHDDRAPARVHPRGRDRRARGLLLVRHERPDADGARVLARRRGREVPHPLPPGRRARAQPLRDPRPERGGRPDADRRGAGERREGRPEARHLRRARRRAAHRSRSATSSGSTTSPARRSACRSPGLPLRRPCSRRRALCTSPRAADGDRRGRPALARHLAARVAGAGRRGVARALQRAHRPPLPPVSRRPRRPRRCGGVRELGVRLGRGAGGVPLRRADRRRRPRHVRVLGGRSLRRQRADDRRRLGASLRRRRARRRSSGTTGRSRSAGGILRATGIASGRAGRSAACTPRGCEASRRGPTASPACR